MEQKRKRKPPAVNYVHYKKSINYSLLLNAAASELLVQDGERFCVTYQDTNGNIFIKPITLGDHAKIISVNIIYKPPKQSGMGMNKITLTKIKDILPLGKHEVVWDGMREALRIKRGRQTTSIL